MLNDKVIRTAFLISFAGHCLFLGIPGISARPTQLNKSEDIIVKIEIEKPPLLPKIDIMGEEKKLKEIVDKPEEAKPKSEPESQPEEEAMAQLPKEPIKERAEIINPAKEAMLRYQDMVKQRIEEVRKYPSWAKRQGIEGIVHLSFTVLSNGLSRDINIVRSSGSKVLDEEAVETVKRANPFPSTPKEISTSFIQMEVSIVFTLQ